MLAALAPTVGVELKLFCFSLLRGLFIVVRPLSSMRAHQISGINDRVMS